MSYFFQCDAVTSEKKLPDPELSPWKKAFNGGAGIILTRKPLYQQWIFISPLAGACLKLNIFFAVLFAETAKHRVMENQINSKLSNSFLRIIIAIEF